MRNSLKLFFYLFCCVPTFGAVYANLWKSRYDTIMKIRELIRTLETDGWFQVRMRGSHRQFKHHIKSGTITVAGNLGTEMPKGTLAAILKKAALIKEN